MTSNELPINKLLNTIKILRSDKGCPWDIKQTPLTLKKYLQEEVGELLEAIDNEDTANIREEIGDVVYVLMMIAEIHSEKANFSFADALDEINSKLIRRHPHVFGDATIKNEEELRQQWQNIKEMEKKRNI